MSVELSRRLFSVDEYHRMMDAGLFGPQDRLELFEGGIVEMNPVGSRHAACVNKLNARLGHVLADKGILGIQNPVTIGPRSELYPDVSVLRKRDDFYAARHPDPKDIQLIIEVADASIDYDRRLKVPLYAQAGIPEVWLIDLQRDTLEVFTHAKEGEFTQVRVARDSDTVPSPLLGNTVVRVDELLP